MLKSFIILKCATHSVSSNYLTTFAATALAHVQCPGGRELDDTLYWTVTTCPRFSCWRSAAACAASCATSDAQHHEND
jgi:hypothetical protein